MEETEQTEQKKQEEELPRWIREREPCLWCDQPMLLIGIEPLDTDQGLSLKYECEHEKCEYLKTFGKKVTYSLRLGDPRYFTNYEEWKKKKEEEKEKKPDDTTVPISVNGKGEEGV